MLLYKAVPLKPGYNKVVSPENAPLKHLEFGRLLLEPGQDYHLEPDGREKALCLLAGQCLAGVSHHGERHTWRIGPRADAFEHRPWAVYLPGEANTLVGTESQSCELAIFFSDAPRDTQPALIDPDRVRVTRPGAHNWRRDVYTLLGADVDCCRLLVGETLNPPGNWSSYPPHKHDTPNPPLESPMEEVYFFLLKPPTGFAIQIVYSGQDDPEPLEEVYLLHHGDTVVLPKGYHPVVGAPGYTLYYLWALAGEERRYGAWSDDPGHAWLRNAEAIIKSAGSG